MAETTITTTTNNFAGNIDLSAIKKKRFTIDGDENRVLELNTSDFSIINRMSECYPKIEGIIDRMSHLSDGVSNNGNDEEVSKDLEAMANNLKTSDNEIRDLINYLFDSNVCEICCSSGSMLDIINGQFRYEFVINALMSLYEETITNEFTKFQNRMAKHTQKYVK